MTSPVDRLTSLAEGLARFSAWLDACSPRHRALRTPVHLEPDAPPAMRLLWETTGFSDAMLPGISDAETRPERCFADPGAEKVIRAWFADPGIRDRWGVTSPVEATRAVRERLPAKTRYVRAVSRVAFFTDETSGVDDPPVLELDRDGAVRPSWPSYVQMVLWQAIANVACFHSSAIAGSLPSRIRALEQPFAPGLAGCWTVDDGIWALESCPVYRNGVPPVLDQDWIAVYESPAHYFRHVMGLPEQEFARHFVNQECMHYLAVKDGKRLDPEHPSTPEFRGYSRPSGANGEITLYRGLAEPDGLRLWLEKRSGTGGTFVYCEPDQLTDVKAFLKREKLQVYEQMKPKKDRFLVAPTAAEIAAARKLHDKARAAAEGT